MKLKHLALGALIWLGAASAAFAQVNAVPQVGITTGYLPKQTYSAGFIGLVPAGSATDLVCISGSATKQIKLMSIKLSGSAGTLVSLPITLLRRASVDTGGTPASTTANPANTISKRDTTFATATATLVSYTANPTIVDTSPTYIDSAQLTLPTTAAGTVILPTVFDYGTDIENNMSPPVLRGIAQQLCVNLNAVSVSSGVLTGTVVWTEE